MKISTIACCLFFLCGCSIHYVSEEASLDACYYPIYQPPQMVPGTNCVNHCQFVYEGVVNFADETLEINCRSFPLISDWMEWKIDSSTVRHVTEGYVSIIKIKTTGFIDWCKRDFSFHEISCLDVGVRQVHMVIENDTQEIRLIMDPGFWNCYSGSDFTFRLTAKSALF